MLLRSSITAQDCCLHSNGKSDTDNEVPKMGGYFTQQCIQIPENFSLFCLLDSCMGPNGNIGILHVPLHSPKIVEKVDEKFPERGAINWHSRGWFPFDNTEMFAHVIYHDARLSFSATKNIQTNCTLWENVLDLDCWDGLKNNVGFICWKHIYVGLVAYYFSYYRNSSVNLALFKVCGKLWPLFLLVKL